MASATSSAKALKTDPRQIAVRYVKGKADEVRARLASLGDLEEQPLSRILILERAPSVSRANAERALQALCEEALIEFWTPVLRDPKSGVRQVLTDEIVLRFKSAGSCERALAELRDRHGITVCRRNEFEPSQYIVKIPQASGMQTLEVARSLDERSDVEFAAPNFLTAVKR